MEATAARNRIVPAPVNGSAGLDGKELAAISREIVQAYAEYGGRGPTRARTEQVGNMIVTELREVFTLSENSLVGAGRFEDVRMFRLALQDTVRPACIRAVEEHTGMTVRTAFSQVSEDDAAIEAFILDDESASG